MNLEYRLIQFVPEPLRNEGRNIAIMAHDGKQAHFRAIGVDASGEIDLESFKTMSGKARDNAWVYREWVGWFQDLRDNEGRDRAELFAILDALEFSNPNFVVRGKGELTDVTPYRFNDALDRLFEELVGHPTKPKQRDFREQINQVLADSFVTRERGFEVDVQVEVSVKGKSRPLMLDFPYLLNGEKRFGFKTVKMRNTTEANLIAQVNDAYFTFERALDLGFLKEGQCIALSERPTDDRQRFAKKLASIAHFVDVSSTDAARYVGHLIFAQ